MKELEKDLIHFFTQVSLNRSDLSKKHSEDTSPVTSVPRNHIAAAASHPPVNVSVKSGNSTPAAANPPIPPNDPPNSNAAVANTLNPRKL